MEILLPKFNNFGIQIMSTLPMSNNYKNTKQKARPASTALRENVTGFNPTKKTEGEEGWKLCSRAEQANLQKLLDIKIFDVKMSNVFYAL